MADPNARMVFLMSPSGVRYEFSTLQSLGNNQYRVTASQIASPEFGRWRVLTTDNATYQLTGVYGQMQPFIEVASVQINLALPTQVAVPDILSGPLTVRERTQISVADVLSGPFVRVEHAAIQLTGSAYEVQINISYG